MPFDEDKRESTLFHYNENTFFIWWQKKAFGKKEKAHFAFNFVIFCHPWRNKNLFDNFSLTAVSPCSKETIKRFFLVAFSSLKWQKAKFNYFVIQKEKRISLKLNFFTRKKTRKRRQKKWTFKEDGEWISHFIWQ